MPVYVVTGKLGGGKSIMSVARIQDKLNRGCKVATNLDLNLRFLVGRKAKNVRVLRVPDKPCLADLEAIGTGNPTINKGNFDEGMNGLLVLDECGTWFNSRSWNDKSRQDIINWFLHARKLGWDIIFIVQNVSIIDKQARLTLAEHVVFCKRTDRLMIPFLGMLIKYLTGSALRLPKMHLGIVKYGDEQNALTVDRWSYWGSSLYSAYDTRQVFSHNYEHGVYTYLPPYYTHYRYRVTFTPRNIMRLTKIYLKKVSRPVAFIAGLAVSFFLFSPPDTELISTVVAEETPAADVALYEGFRVLSYAKMPNQPPSYLIGNGEQIVRSTELAEQGYTVEPVSRCRLTLRAGEQHLNLTCGG